MKKLLECLAIAVIARVAGITQDIADVKSLGVYLRDNVMSAAKHIVDYVFGIIKILGSGDYHDFFHRVALVSNDHETIELSRCSLDFLVLKSKEYEVNEMSSRIVNLELKRRRVDELFEQAELNGRLSVAARARLLSDQMKAVADDWRRYATGRSARKEPLMIWADSVPGSGKSLTTLCFENALGRALKVVPVETPHLIYNWATGHEFQEGFEYHTRGVFIDEVYSVTPEYDSNVGCISNDLLAFGSSMPFTIPMAFEGKKGKHTSANILLVGACSNASPAVIERLFSGRGENLRRRVLVTKYIPKGIACVEGKFEPSRVPVEKRSISGLAEFMDVECVSHKFAVPEVVFRGSILEFCDFLTSEVVARLHGDQAAIGKWLASLRDYKPPEVAMTVREAGVAQGLFDGSTDDEAYPPGVDYDQMDDIWAFTVILTGIIVSFVIRLPIFLQFSFNSIIQAAFFGLMMHGLYRWWLFTYHVRETGRGAMWAAYHLARGNRRAAQYRGVLILENLGFITHEQAVIGLERIERGVPQFELEPSVWWLVAIPLILFWDVLVWHLVLVAPRNWQRYWTWLYVRDVVSKISAKRGWVLKRRRFVRYVTMRSRDTMDFVHDLDDRLRRAFYFFQQLLKKRSVQALLALVGVAGAVMLHRTFGLSSEDDKVPVKGSAQGYHMPLELPPDSGNDLPTESKNFLGKVLPVLKQAKGDGLLYRLAKQGTGMQMNALDKIRANMITLSAYVSNNKGYDVFGMRVFDTSITISHILPKIDGSVVHTAAVGDPLQVFPFELDQTSVVINRSLDLAFLPNAFPSNTRDVGFSLEGDVVVRPGDEVVLVDPDARRDLIGYVSIPETFCTYSMAGISYNTLCCKVAWREGGTVNGWCGKPCFLKKVSRNKKGVDVEGYHFIGLLVAGEVGGVPGVPSSSSFISRLSLKDLQIAAASAANKISVIPRLAGIPQSTVLYEHAWPDVVEKWPSKGIFSYPDVVSDFGVAVLGESQEQMPPRGSRLEPTPFHDVGVAVMAEVCPTVHYRPAVQETTIRFDDELGVNKHVSPYEDGLKRGDFGGVVNVGRLREFCDGIVAFVKQKCHGISSRVLTIDEAMLARPGLAAVDPNKAAALPEAGVKGSFMYESWKAGEPMERFADERLRTEVSRLMISALSGGIGSITSKASLKDELVNDKKYETVATRIFECVSFAPYMIYRMMLGDCIGHMIGALRSLGSCIGINASSPDWTWLHSRTDPSIHGGQLLSTDYVKMDKRMLYICYVCALHIVFVLWMFFVGTSVPQEVVWMFGRILMGATRPQRKADGAIVFGFAGNLSGDFLTTLINTIVNMMYWWFVCSRLDPTLTFERFVRDFLKHAGFYGDDTRILLLPSYRFSDNDLILSFAHFGQKITTAGVQKSSFVVETNGGKTFLKRGFRKVGDRVFCPLEVASLLKSLLFFIRGSLPDDERHISVLRSLWEEAFFHDDETKVFLRGVVSKCLLNLPPKYHAWRFRSDGELLARWDSGEFKVWEL